MLATHGGLNGHDSYGNLHPLFGLFIIPYEEPTRNESRPYYELLVLIKMGKAGLRMIKGGFFWEITLKKDAYIQEKKNKGSIFLENEKLVTERD